MRRTFIKTLEELAAKDKDVFLITADVGFGVLESFAEKFPKNFINAGIGEANAVGIATGLALKGKKPFVYSINSFLLFKAFEQIRMLSYMKQHVVLIGVGKEDEYTNQGISHYSFGDERALSSMPITVLTPESKEDVVKKVLEAYKNPSPHYIRLSRF